MLKQIKKLPKYALKWFREGSASELFHMVRNVKPKHLLIALAARLDRKATHVQFRDSILEHEINQFMELIPFRRKRIVEDIYLWEFGQKHICCNYMQLLGLREEFIGGLFDDIYRYDWKGKRVVDIGGFVGDTALHFLSEGAGKIFVYEPVSKNMQALKFNLKRFDDKIECFQEALADKNGPFTLFSDEPECSCGFGIKQGKHELQCQGISITDILNRHAPIDVMKVDCEGGEEHLLGMTESEISSVPYWIIETHSSDLHQQITKKFCENGFSIVNDKVLAPSVNLIHFKKRM